jgi:hypothetical protein
MMTVSPKAPSGAKAKQTRPKASKPSLDDFMAALGHPLKADIEAVRKMVLGADKGISEGVKWNSLSFRTPAPTEEWFATINLRSRDSVQVVMHLGAKVGKAAPTDEIPDPKGLLKWLGKDRAMATLGAGAALKANQAAFKAIVKAWVRYV